MPKLTLVYFDFHGGRGEPARLALSIGGVPFEDKRVTFAEWSAMKKETPYGALPVLEVDGKRVAQSNGINRYVGKLAGLYPSDPLEAAFCDEPMDAVEDISAKIVPTMFLSDEAEKKRKRQELAEGAIPEMLSQLQARLRERGGHYFADGKLTIADLKVFLWIRHLKSGQLDHIPTDIADRHAPLLVEHYERVKAHPGVKSYYESRGVALP
jgi:glutathione S-transferase